MSRHADTSLLRPLGCTSAQFIYESIHSAILARRLAPAAMLSQVTLTQIFRAGANSVRRALERLASDGAVEFSENQIAYVAQPDPLRVRQVLEARLLVESAVARQLAGQLSRQQLDDLRSIVAAERACMNAADHAGLIKCAGRLHLQLAELTGNPLLHNFLDQLLRQAALHLALSKNHGYIEASCCQQLELLDALEAGDCELASKRLELYLSSIGQRLRYAPPPTTDLHAAFAGRLSS
ncbi:GntR family transcriptional regulator [Pseudomonas sp.]|uniref:GntR family transcriptional regulator n=1 Tax=Pseudomonas sp. TaxID=306 RepID=UPI003A973635